MTVTLEQLMKMYIHMLPESLGRAEWHVGADMYWEILPFVQDGKILACPVVLDDEPGLSFVDPRLTNCEIPPKIVSILEELEFQRLWLAPRVALENV